MWQGSTMTTALLNIGVEKKARRSNQLQGQHIWSLAVMVRTRTQSSVIPFLVPRRKVWLTLSAWVPCSNAVNIRECKSWTQSEFCTWQNSVRWQEPLKIYTKCTSPGDDQTLCIIWMTSVERCRCRNKPRCKTHWNLLECPKLTNRSSAEIHHTVRRHGGNIAV